MAMPRESGFFPTIKCSACSRDVEISMMGDHICDGELGEVLQTPDHFHRQPIHQPYNHAYDQQDDQPYDLQPPAKYGRIAPVGEIGAANRPYMDQGQFAPFSQPHDPRNALPESAYGRSPPARTDDYLNAQSDGTLTPPARHPRRPGGYGGFADQHAHSSERPSGGGLPQRIDVGTPGLLGPFQASPGPHPPLSPRNAAFDRTHDAFNDHAATSFSQISTAPPRMPLKASYEGFGPPLKAGADFDSAAPRSINRSETFPLPSFPVEPPLRTPSAPGTRPERLRKQSVFDSGRRPSIEPDTSRAPPPRTSLLRPHTAGKQGVPVNVAAEFGIGNPYHTPSDSASSGYSTFSHPSQTSSQSSPARSQVTRKPSDTNNIDDLMNDLQTSMEDMGANDHRTDFARAAPGNAALLQDTTPQALYPRDHPTLPHGRQEDMPSHVVDRTLRGPHLGASPQQNSYFPTSSPARRQQSPDRFGTSPPSPRTMLQPRKASNALPPRGDCKACGLGIRGKSISSADGRLTGKYHKACFVCTTCAQPFASAEFYVLGDKPYCEQHYHGLNGSLCGGCGRGIEGQYLEDEALAKYHVGCFRCLDCGLSLSDGYFDVDGRSYCERDAWRRVHGAEIDPYAPSQAPFPRGAASGPGRPPMGKIGLPGRPAPRYGAAGGGLPRPLCGMPGPGSRPPLGMKPAPQMNKRMTRLGMM